MKLHPAVTKFKSEMKRLNVLKGRPMMEGLKTTTNKKKRRKKHKVKKN